MGNTACRVIRGLRTSFSLQCRGWLNIEDPLEWLIWQTDLANKQGGVNYSQLLFSTNCRWILNGFGRKRHIFESSRHTVKGVIINQPNIVKFNSLTHKKQNKCFWIIAFIPILGTGTLCIKTSVSLNRLIYCTVRYKRFLLNTSK